VSTSLLFSTGAVSRYPASMVNFIWFTDEKNVYHVSTKQHGGLKSGILRAINSTISQSLCAGSCSQQQKSSYPHKCVKAIVLSDFFGCNGKTSEICHKRTIR